MKAQVHKTVTFEGDGILLTLELPSETLAMQRWEYAGTYRSDLSSRREDDGWGLMGRPVVFGGPDEMGELAALLVDVAEYIREYRAGCET